MKLFGCDRCGQLLFFENAQCARCGSRLAYVPQQVDLRSLEPAPPADTGADPAPAAFDLVEPRASAARGSSPSGSQRYRLCGNAIDHGVCNWAIPIEAEDRLCESCRLNDTIPNLGVEGAREAWERLEIAKRRLLYSLMQLGLELGPDPRGCPGLRFVFAADQGDVKVFTGHSNGVVTINVAEAHAPSRERTREDLGEAYRTLLGHFRHESGHYYWDRLVKDTAGLEPFRATFGDERASYDEAREAYYARGAPGDWPGRYVSAYASMHPWEDWAETFAHYLHMIDTLETARAYGMALRPHGVAESELDAVAAVHVDSTDFEAALQAWIPLTVALNSLNRSMGLPDLYPFVLSERATEKLRFVHGVIRGFRVA